MSSMEEIKYGMCQVGRRSNMACVKYGGDQIWHVSSMDEIKYGMCQVW